MEIGSIEQQEQLDLWAEESDTETAAGYCCATSAGTVGTASCPSSASTFASAACAC